MHAITASRSRGFSLLELLIGLSILGTLLALGVPAFNGWQLKTRVVSASQFYLDGFRTARLEAIKHNSASRLVLIDNATSGQYDWRVDICFPMGLNSCDRNSVRWSSITANAADDPEPGNGVKFTSVFRSATLLPKDSTVNIDLVPGGAQSAYFTSTGWLNTTLGANLTRLELRPVVANAFIPLAVAVTLGGGAAVCMPDLPANTLDSRRCP